MKFLASRVPALVLALATTVALPAIGADRGGGNPAPQAYRVTDAQLRSYANQQARTVANRVANTYGKLENWRYNFVEGFWMSMAELSNYRLAGYPGSSEYHQGRGDGASEGMQRGGDDGRREAISRAGSMAGQDAESRFAAVVNHPELQPDTQIRVPDVAFPGLQAAVRAVSLDARLNELDSKLQTELALLSWSIDGWAWGYSAYGERWSLRTVYGYGGSGKYAFVENWFRADYALGEWKNNGLGGRYDYNIYNKLEQDQKNTFGNYFRQTYDQVIDEKFFRVKMQPNPEARLRGMFYGQQVGASQAYEEGRVEGFAPAYTESSRQAFLNAFPGQYRGSFDGAVQRYLTSPVLRLAEFRLLDANRNGVFEPGEKIDVEIDSMVNLGRVAANGVDVALSGEGIAPLAHGTVSLGASSSNQGAILVAGLAQVDANVRSDKENSLSLSVGSEIRRASFTVSWSGVLGLFSKADEGSSDYQGMSRFILDTVKTEWLETIKHWSNRYRKDKDLTQTQLGQLVAYYKKVDDKGKRNLRALADALGQIEKSGGGWHPFKRRAFRKFVDQLR